ARVLEAADRKMDEKTASIGPELMRQIEKSFVLQTLDHHWREHLVQLDHLRHTIGLRGYAQRDPLNEYKSEAFALFESLLARLRQDATAHPARIDLAPQAPPPPPPELPKMRAEHINPDTGENEMPEGPLAQTTIRTRSTGPVDPARPESWG